jgi:endonuclease G, mitochondrial
MSYCIDKRFLGWIFALVFSLSSAFSQLPGNVTNTPTDSSWKVHVSAGIPFDDDHSDDYIILRSQYVLSYCNSKKTANWVAWELSSSWFGETPRRKGNFLTDPLLPDTFYRVKHSDYTNSGFDRGHIVRSEERTASEEDNRSTFYMTNVMPQTPDLNQGVWLKFELFCEDLCKKENKTLYIYSGGVFHSDSTVKGEGLVLIPDSCFKIVLVMDEGQSIENLNENTKIIAVMMPNIHGVRRDEWQKYITTVSHIEKSTGYNFFSALDEELQNYLENKTYFPD